jgi:hypothetical protein
LGGDAEKIEIEGVRERETEMVREISERRWGWKTEISERRWRHRDNIEINNVPCIIRRHGPNSVHL